MLWVEDFESGLGLPSDEGGLWGFNNTNPHSGTYCYSHVPIADSQSATWTLTVPPGATTIQFWHAVSSEPTHDKLEFLINGVVKLTAHGTVPWTQSAVFNLAGATQVVFRYSKDSSVSTGSDAAYIDDIVFQVPDLTSPRTNNLNGGTNGTAITTGNSGGASGSPFTNVVGSPQFSNANPFGGSGLVATNGVAGADTHIDWQALGTVGDALYLRVYLYWAGAIGPATFKPLMALLGPTGVVSKVWMGNSTLKFRIATGGGTTAAVTGNAVMPVNQWVRLEFCYTIDSAGNGTSEMWTYLDPESAAHDDYVISPITAWPGGKPRTAEFHLWRDSGDAGRWYMDELAVGPDKLGPAPSTVSRRPRATVGASRAAHRAATW
ncbi:hypothetical protein [Nonomuraea sediminis]|uniref:hypothetical protein n=1 Tax=Nonomuraea sediminis TaxID=2835864 RepID=UPI001BDCC791|nr:hypothetical protein [Nonomuraea sediminis]